MGLWLRRRGLVLTVVIAVPSIPPEGGTATARGCHMETKEHGPCAKGLRFAGAGVARDRLKAEGKTNGCTSGDGGGGLSAVWEMSGPTYVVAFSFRRICA